MHRLGMIVVLSVAHLAATGSFETVLAQEEIKSGGRRIVGGEKTDISKHRWQVALKVSLPGGFMRCGGTIIANKWVLTAAHCLVSGHAVARAGLESDERAAQSLTKKTGVPRVMQPNSVTAKAGVTDYLKQGRWSDVDTVVIHEGYDPRTQENDIALVRLKSRPSGKVIPLASTSIKIPVGQPLEITGWGGTSEGGVGSSDLLKAKVPYVGNDTCNEPESYNGRISSGMLCAGRREGGVDACQGDSGGPLVWNTGDGPVLVGVVSFGKGCARKLKYGVYTRVANYRDWIARTMAANKR